MSRKMTKEEFLSRVSNLDRIEIIGDYVDTHTKILVRCKTCGHEWGVVPQRLMRGHGCPQCAYAKRRGKQYHHKTDKEFVSELAIRNPNIIPKSVYINARSKVNCECKTCGYTWDAKASNLLSGFGCPQCAKINTSQKQIKSHDTFVKELAELNPTVKAIEEYAGNRIPITVSCMICNHTWKAMPLNLLRKDGKATSCPICRRSHGEITISQWLDENAIEYTPQYKFDDLVGVGGHRLSYDFYVPEYNTLIEYQGEYHDHTASLQTDEEFAIQQEHDRRKEEYAQSNGYVLLPIWYYENIQKILSQQLV